MGNTEKIIKSIINQRNRLIKMNLSGKNTARCFKIINQLSIQMDAYKKVWNSDGWNRFLERNIEDLQYLIPNNKSGETIKKNIHAIIYNSKNK